jgi:hypothetical protein
MTVQAIDFFRFLDRAPRLGRSISSETMARFIRVGPYQGMFWTRSQNLHYELVVDGTKFGVAFIAEPIGPAGDPEYREDFLGSHEWTTDEIPSDLQMIKLRLCMVEAAKPVQFPTAPITKVRP